LVALASVAANRKDPPVKQIFNISQLILATAAGAAVFFALGGQVGVSSVSAPVLVGQIVAADIAIAVANGLLVATIVHLAEGVPFRQILGGTMLPETPAHLGYGLFGLLLAVLWDGVGVGPFAAVLVLIPLFTARWAYAQYAEQQLAYDRTIRTLIQAVETKDLYTRGHSERVAHGSVLIARRLRLPENRIPLVRYAGILHDVGKLGVPTRVLQKAGRLSEEEFATIRMHPVRGLETVQGIEFLRDAYEGILHHHERVDGRGYPMGLSGDQIPEIARIIAVADAFDSMTTTRSYRSARSVEEAVAELRAGAGSQFDPRMVEAMITALDEEGWHPAPVRPGALLGSDANQGTVAAFDHDDPTLDLQPVTGPSASGGASPGRTNERPPAGGAPSRPDAERGGEGAG
jgi:hypothetical protein